MMMPCPNFDLIQRGDEKSHPIKETISNKIHFYVTIFTRWNVVSLELLLSWRKPSGMVRHNASVFCRVKFRRMREAPNALERTYETCE